MSDKLKLAKEKTPKTNEIPCTFPWCFPFCFDAGYYQILHNSNENEYGIKSSNENDVKINSSSENSQKLHMEQVC